VRPTRIAASVALTTALALVALPGIVGSRSPSSGSAVDPEAFLPLTTAASALGRMVAIGPLDPSFVSAGRLGEATAFTEPGVAPEPIGTRPRVRQPASQFTSALKPPRYKLTGYATFYDNGTTAMRLPRGTTVIVCGAGGCIERIISDYGPVDFNQRIVDLYTPDFFDICGCPSWAGTTWVTVSVY
jgi:hypothetical protein